MKSFFMRITALQRLGLGLAFASCICSIIWALHLPKEHTLEYIRRSGLLPLSGIMAIMLLGTFCLELNNHLSRKQRNERSDVKLLPLWKSPIVWLVLGIVFMASGLCCSESIWSDLRWFGFSIGMFIVFQSGGYLMQYVLNKIF